MGSCISAVVEDLAASVRRSQGFSGDAFPGSFLTTISSVGAMNGTCSARRQGANTGHHHASDGATTVVRSRIWARPLSDLREEFGFA